MPTIFQSPFSSEVPVRVLPSQTVMTLPVVIVATEESLKAIPPGLRVPGHVDVPASVREHRGQEPGFSVT